MKPETAILRKLTRWPLATFWEPEFQKGSQRFPNGKSGSLRPHCLYSKQFMLCTCSFLSGGGGGMSETLVYTIL